MGGGVIELMMGCLNEPNIDRHSKSEKGGFIVVQNIIKMTISILVDIARKKEKTLQLKILDL